MARHQTLRQAVAWSYDLLDDAEKALLDRCSVFAGGFDLQGACAITGSDDDYTVLDLLDALVRKSLLIADRSSGQTRYSMLETIRQFAEEQLTASGAADQVRGAHARYFAGREADVLALWDSPRQREAYAWVTAELANLRAAFRWAADCSDLDVAAPIAISAASLCGWLENFEPLSWVEELIEPARAINHPRLAGLYAMASTCYMTGRIDPAVRYTEAAQTAISSDGQMLPYGAEGFVGSAHLTAGLPERWVQWCRARLARGSDTPAYTTACLVIGLALAGRLDEAMAAADGLVDAAEATGNPYVLSFALLAYGLAYPNTDPDGTLAALQRGLTIAQSSGNRANETHLLANLSRLQAEYGDPLAALDYFALAIRKYHDAGNMALVHHPLGLLAAFFDRLGRHEPAATIARFAEVNAIARAWPEITTAITHLRDVLGDTAYESLARRGERMTIADMVTYAYDQIDQARAELNTVAK
jgi:hypothetical protein